MTPLEIEHIIANELRSEPDHKNVFGLDLTECLIEPVKQKYKGLKEAGETYDLWTVLEESKDKKGYKIYFDEETGMFGLGITSEKDELIDIGTCGTFLEALDCM
ncbi:MAG: hypothetical protein K0S33_150 [Bacteroidetes bacterium]|jgi:hypothetical protein|nr:hypothetical protein [Bacteroidota bacterium]